MLNVCRALANVIPKQNAAVKLSRLCQDLIDDFDPRDPRAIVKLEVVSGIGRAAPDIFAQHVAHIVDDVLRVTPTLSQ